MLAVFHVSFVILTLFIQLLFSVKGFQYNSIHHGKVQRKFAFNEKQTESIGKIYKFTGPSNSNNPPPELASLLGKQFLKKKRTHKKKITGTSVSKSKQNINSMIEDNQSQLLQQQEVERLERDVISKYRPNKYRNIQYDDDDVDNENHETDYTKKNIFNIQNNNRYNSYATHIPLKDNHSIRRSKLNSTITEMFHGRTQKNTELLRHENSNIQSKEGFKSTANYRLRPIAPIDPIILYKKQQQELILLQKEKLKERNIKEKLLHNKSLFKPFSFPIDNITTQSLSTEFLSNTNFIDLCIKEPILLQNLAKIGLERASFIQELSIPAINNHENIIIQAQTGSGKTLAYLLPLLNMINIRNKEVRNIFSFIFY